MELDMEVDKVANKVADMVADEKNLSDMELDLVADMEVDKVAVKVAGMAANMVADKDKNKLTSLALLHLYRLFLFPHLCTC